MSRRHDQRPDKSLFVCKNCKDGNCDECIDVLRMIYADDTICKCERQGHDGEPASQQILDPETGAVHGPCMTVSPEGKVKIEHDTYEDQELGSRYVIVRCKRCAYSIRIEQQHE